MTSNVIMSMRLSLIFTLSPSLFHRFSSHKPGTLEILRVPSAMRVQMKRCSASTSSFLNGRRWERQATLPECSGSYTCRSVPIVFVSLLSGMNPRL